MVSGEPASGFLPAVESDLSRAFRPRPRKHARLTPIIDARMTFRLIEAAILTARSTVELAYWDLQTDLPVQLADARDRGLATWKDLLLDAALRGVSVRVIFNDFDPDLARTFHGEAWQSYAELALAAGQSALTGGLDAERLQVICSLHPLTVPLTLELAGAVVLERLKLLKELNDIAAGREGLGGALFRLGNMPRAWPVVTVDRAARRFSLTGAQFRAVHVGSFHDKICTVDDRIAFCGGIDPKVTVLDGQHHEAAPFRHDIACVIEGPCVADIVHHFNDRWDGGLAPFRDFVAAANAAAPAQRIQVTPLAFSPRRTAAPETAGTGIAQVLRTQVDELVVSPGEPPRGQRWDHWEAYRRLIGSAREFVYIENQYLRWPGVADLLIDRFKANPALKVIVVLPFAPEEATAGDIDLVTQHGMHLQFEIVTRLKAELKHSIGFFTLIARSTASEDDPQDTGTLFGSPRVYVHSKLCIVDDAFAIIGSANLDGLSLFVHGELSIGWFQPRQVANFRAKLWQELLGVAPAEQASWPRSLLLHHWFRIAGLNVVRPPQSRSGFVVPLDLALLGHGTRHDFIPDVLARGLGSETAGPQAVRRRRRAALEVT